MRRGWSLGNLVKKTQFSGNLKKHRPKHWSQMYMFVVSGALALGPRGNQPIPIRGPVRGRKCKLEEIQSPPILGFGGLWGRPTTLRRRVHGTVHKKIWFEAQISRKAVF